MTNQSKFLPSNCQWYQGGKLRLDCVNRNQSCKNYQGKFTSTEIAHSGLYAVNHWTGDSKDERLCCIECGLMLENIPDVVSLVLLHLVCPHCPYVQRLLKSLNSDWNESRLETVEGVGGDNPSPIRFRDEIDIQKDDTPQVVYDKHNTLRYRALGLPDFLRAQVLQLKLSEPNVSSDLTSPDTFVSLGLSSNAETVQMAREEIRRNTFTTFPNDHLLNLERLIQAGFYWTGVGIEMKTFCCGKTCSDWTNHSDPILRHAQLASSCTFLKTNYQPEYLVRLLQGNEKYEPAEPKILIEKAMMKHIKPIMDSLPVVSIRNNWKAFTTVGGTWESLKKELLDCIAERIKYGKGGYETEVEVIQDLQILRTARQEKTISKPVHELNDIKVFIDRSFTREIMKKQEREAREKRPATNRQQGDRLDINTSDVTTSMRCLICLSELREILYLPCTHLVTCAGCSLTQAMCPVCRGTIKGTVKVRLLSGNGAPPAISKPAQPISIDLVNPNIPDINLREILEIAEQATQETDTATTSQSTAEREENKMDEAGVPDNTIHKEASPNKEKLMNREKDAMPTLVNHFDYAANFEDTSTQLNIEPSTQLNTDTSKFYTPQKIDAKNQLSNLESADKRSPVTSAPVE